MEKKRPGNYLPEDKGMIPKEIVMLQSKSSAAEIVCDGRLVGIVEGSGIHAQHILDKFAEAWRNRLVATNSPSLIENGNKIIGDKDAIEVVNGRLVTYGLTLLDSQNNGCTHIVHLIFTPAYFVIEIPTDGHIFVTSSGKGPAIKAMVEKDMVLGEDLSFHKAFFLGCEGMEGAQKEDIHTEGFRRAFTADGTFMENFWMEGDDVQKCCLPNNVAPQTVEEKSLLSSFGLNVS